MGCAPMFTLTLTWAFAERREAVVKKASTGKTCKTRFINYRFGYYSDSKQYALFNAEMWITHLLRNF
jgi:hypothetical protein